MAAVNRAVFPPHPARRRRSRPAESRAQNAKRIFLPGLPKTRNPGRTAALVRSATRASPDAVHAANPKNGTNTPCGGVMFVSIRIPIVSPRFIAASSPRAKSSLCRTRLPCWQRISFTQSIHPRIVEPPDHHRHGMPHQRMPETGKLPRPQVAGDDQDTLASLLRCQVCSRPS